MRYTYHISHCAFIFSLSKVLRYGTTKQATDKNPYLGTTFNTDKRTMAANTHINRNQTVRQGSSFSLTLCNACLGEAITE